MKNLTFLIIYSVFSFLPYEFPNDPTISDEQGNPVSDSTFYFQHELFIDSIKWANETKIKIDSFSVKWFSQNLWFSKEPVLYNYFLGRSIYRLTWLRSFHPAIVLRLENRNGEISLIEKKMILIDPWKELSEDELTEEHKKYLRKGAGPVKEYRPDSASIESNTLRLNSSDWTNFEKLLDSQNFKSMPTTRAWEFGTDGSEWIIEQHKEGKYHVVNRWSPNERQYSEFRKIGDFLINLSSYSKEERY